MLVTTRQVAETLQPMAAVLDQMIILFGEKVIILEGYSETFIGGQGEILAQARSGQVTLGHIMPAVGRRMGRQTQGGIGMPTLALAGGGAKIHPVRNVSSAS
jgi:hypothetical protein